MMVGKGGSFHPLYFCMFGNLPAKKHKRINSPMIFGQNLKMVIHTWQRYRKKSSFKGSKLNYFSEKQFSNMYQSSFEILHSVQQIHF